MAEKEIIEQATQNSGGLIAALNSVIGFMAAFVTAVMSFLFKRVIDKHDQEIESIKSGIKAIDDKVSACVPMEVWEQNRRETRENVVTLHGKVERAQDRLSGEMSSMRDHVDAKIDRLADLIRAQR